MHTLDYIILFVPVAVMFSVSIFIKRYVTSVADFLVASRCAGRYLICNAVGEASFGAVSIVAIFEYIQKTGFVLKWWDNLGGPVLMFLTLFGFVAYRYRESRVMTMAQFFEIRYSRRFRVFAGILAFISGVLNFAIFPAVGARFFVNYCGFPQQLSLFGVHFPSFWLVMLITVSCTLFFILTGGQMTIMITDCLEGLFTNVLYLAIAAALLLTFTWNDIYTALAAAPVGQSMLNPFDTSNAKDFNMIYALILVVGNVYTFMSWQGTQGFRGAAISAHEAKMANILGTWRGVARGLMVTLLGICAVTFLTNPKFAAGALQVNEVLKNIPETQIQSQMRIPVALSIMLPVGIKGAFACLVLFAILAADGAYMHSWGSIFIQDVVLPFRKKHFSPDRHIKVLRYSIIGVAIFALLFGMFFNQTEHILMFTAITGAIFLGGSGAVVLGGFYWKKGTTSGAWVSMILGSFFATSSIVVQQSWKALQPVFLKIFHSGQWHEFFANHPDKFPVNGQILYAVTMAISCGSYIVVSLLTCMGDYNMDKMLHRGAYAVETPAPGNIQPKSGFRWGKFIGITKEFTRFDRWLATSVFLWNVLWFSIFVLGSLLYWYHPWSLKAWGDFWFYAGVLLPFIITAVSMVWFTWGGISDLKALINRLNVLARNPLDDGTVTSDPGETRASSSEAMTGHEYSSAELKPIFETGSK